MQLIILTKPNSSLAEKTSLESSNIIIQTNQCPKTLTLLCATSGEESS